MNTIYKYKRGNMTINNFKDNKGAMVNYYNNIRNKEYVEVVTTGYSVADRGYCVNVVYKK